jgi:hypothetical protein
MSQSHLRTLQEWRMSLILDTYVDIFSSFDPRPYSERALSDDFLDECKKIVLDKWIDLIELRLMIPDVVRIPEDEEVIKKRLHSYFLVLSHTQSKMRRKDTVHAWVLIAVWVIIGIVVSYILHKYAFAYMWTTVIQVVWEPASRLLIWTWADRLLQYFWRERDAYQFAERLSRAKIQFYGY